MERIENLTIEGEHVTIDDVHFVSCTLVNCILRYAGGEIIFDSNAWFPIRPLWAGSSDDSVPSGTGLMPHDPAEWTEFSDTIN